jgi:hypothetical protein
MKKFFEGVAAGAVMFGLPLAAWLYKSGALA